MTPSYRAARRSDAPAIAALHTASWRAAYRGLLPDAFLDTEVEAEHVDLWHQRFKASDAAPVTVTVVAEHDGSIVGFAHSIVDEDPKHGTLLDNLHVHPDAKRLGIGRYLMAETAARLAAAGSQCGLYLWVLEQNARARSFYEALGGVATGHDLSPAGGGSASCVRYSWPVLSELPRTVRPPEGRHDQTHGHA